MSGRTPPTGGTFRRIVMQRRALLILATVAVLAPPAAKAAVAPACPHGGYAAGAAAVDITPRPPAGHTLGEGDLGGDRFGPGRPTALGRGGPFARGGVGPGAGGPR